MDARATPATHPTPATRMIDPRQPRFGQAITGSALLVGFVLEWEPILPILAGILAAASLGPATNLYARLYPAFRGLARLRPPAELEEAAPPRFANTVGFAFLTAASLLQYALEASAAAWSLGLIVSTLALLAATSGLCVGCEIYVLGRRVATRGRISQRITVTRGGAGA